MNLPAVEVDPAEAFALFALHAGNVERVAVILDTDPAAIEAMAKRWKWSEKVVRTQGDAEDSSAAQREVNRGVNYLQAHRLRSMVDRVLVELAMPGKLEDATTIVGMNGSHKRDYRVLRDVAEAARTAQDLTYRALGDSVDLARNDKAKGKAGDLSLGVLAAMDAADAAPGTSSVDIVRKSLRNPA